VFKAFPMPVLFNKLVMMEAKIEGKRVSASKGIFFEKSVQEGAT
jgi:hypothetical protein